MSADYCIAYYGVRFVVKQEEVEGIEKRTDPRIQQARKCGLQYWWDDFEGSGEEDAMCLYIGVEIGRLGIEDELYINKQVKELLEVFESTKEKLRGGGFDMEPSIFFHYKVDV